MLEYVDLFDASPQGRRHVEWAVTIVCFLDEMLYVVILFLEEKKSSYDVAHFICQGLRLV
jgi:hypothetical protein